MAFGDLEEAMRTLAAHALKLDAPGDGHVVLRSLSQAEAIRDYASLRFATLRDELGWTHSNLRTPEELLDNYDSTALAYGVLTPNGLIGAIRLVAEESAHALPSGRFLGDSLSSLGVCAELSKGVVNARWRRYGVFTALIAACVHTARVAGITRLFASIINTEKGLALFSQEGFQPIGEVFHYTDSIIAAPEPAILLAADFRDTAFDERRSLTRTKSLLAMIEANMRDHPRA